MNENALLEVKGISKYFPGVQALGGVDLDIRPGEVHAVVGENGAGKSTLMKVLTGVYHRDDGEYLFEGKPVSFTSVHQSISLGISCIYQELTIVPLLDVARNLYLGNLPMKSKLQVDYKKLYSDAQKVLETLEMDVSPKAFAKDLSVAQHQMLEIGRAVSRNSKIIIMDEPTSSLSANETRVLFNVIRKLTAKGIAIFYISHKLEEITEISNRISVFRDGKKIITFDNSPNVSSEMIIGHMIGRKIENYFNKQVCKIGDVALEVRDLSLEGVFKNISFNVHKGEVLGFFGLIGAGRSEVMTSLFGVNKLDKGEIFVNGEKKTFHDTTEAIKAGLALVPEDRRQQGLFLKQSVKFNEMIIKMKQINTLGVIDEKKEMTIAGEFKTSLNVKTPSLHKSVGELSGGNQQKVVIAKWLMMSPKILILDEPTRGIDVGAKSEIYRLINELAAKGVAVIVISSELIEVLGISDRIIVMHEGQMTGELNSSETNSAEVMAAALGGRKVSQ